MVLILGAGESGIGAAILAHKKSQQVFVSDSGLMPLSNKHLLIDHDIDFEENGHTIALELQPKVVIKSPGISDDSEIVKHFSHKNIEIISEIEYAFRNTDKPILAITGSNGKTTTTRICTHILKSAGFQVCEAGNVGVSFARAVATEECDWFVLEVSSFQLDGVKYFSPEISILLNITPDHLDRYDYSFEKYAKAKCRIFENQSASQHFIYNANDAGINTTLNQYQINPVCHPVHSELDVDGHIYNDGKFVADLSHSALKGKHNAFNATCAALACRLVGASDEVIQEALTTFVNDPHRLELCSSWNGVDWINDSKATNVDSVWYALDAMSKPVIWIAGGQDKGNDYEQIASIASKKVKALICMGLDNKKLIHFFEHKIDTVTETHSMKEAMETARNLAKAGDVVLLSPACASFDLFKNYQDRGNQFKAAVREWESTNHK